jgi:hypothetical protein
MEAKETFPALLAVCADAVEDVLMANSELLLLL